MEIITIICIANYCRSPVIEVILNKRLGHKYQFNSAGISPMADANMDPRSREFLEEKNFNPGIHTPKPASKGIVNSSSLILGADIRVITLLNQQFPSFRNKIKLITNFNPTCNLTDPYKKERQEYLEVMESILILCDSITEESIENIL